MSSTSAAKSAAPASAPGYVWRDARSNDPARQVFGNHRGRADNRRVTDRDSREHEGTGADPHVGADRDRGGFHPLLFDGDVGPVVAMRQRQQHALESDERVLANGEATACVETGVAGDADSVGQAQAGWRVYLHARADTNALPDVGAAATQQPHP